MPGVEFDRGLFMHTFFVNTTGKELENYSDIFEIQHETRRLVSLDCPLSEWHDEEKGYKACVSKMGRLIDSYKDINNDFILIIYVDLLAYEAYTSIPMQKDRERYACLKVLRSVLKHYIKGTFVDEMNECGRVPQEVLIIFEENQQPKDSDEKTEDGKNLIRSYARLILGLPSASEMDKIVYNTVPEATDVTSAERFCEKIAESACSCIGEKVLRTYWDQVDTFVQETKNYDTSEQPFIQLLDRIIGCSAKDDEVVCSVTFVSNRRVGVAAWENKAQTTRRNLALCAYIDKCIREKKVIEELTTVQDVDWQTVAENLGKKRATFREEERKIGKIGKKYSELELAPKLYILSEKDKARLWLDDYGDTQSPSEEPKEGLLGDGYKDFSGKLPSEPSEMNTPEEYEAAAEQLRRHHRNYLQNLQIHVRDRLSRYAGQSREGDCALFSKRKVSVADEDTQAEEREYRYKSGNNDLKGSSEKGSSETVDIFSEKAYASAMADYMAFCAGRSVAVTDIEEQCDWFIRRVKQIKESLEKLQIIAVGMLFAILALYIPFVVLQWEAITENAMTVMVALFSLILPIALLYGIFAVVAAKQRKKYRQAWDMLKKKSDDAEAENKETIRKFDQLLTLYAPKLRYIYEYKLDVDFYEECCKLAKAKIEHHRKKLHERVVTIGNIIEDLEVDVSAEKPRNNAGTTQSGSSAPGVDKGECHVCYAESFCADKNADFYAILDGDIPKVAKATES